MFDPGSMNGGNGVHQDIDSTDERHESGNQASSESRLLVDVDKDMDAGDLRRRDGRSDREEDRIVRYYRAHHVPLR